MFKLTFSSIRDHKARFFLSAFAVALGVAFMAGTLVLADTLGRAADGITATAAEGTDALVRSSRVVTDADTDTDVRGSVDDTTLAAVRAVPSVAAAEPRIEGIAQLVGPDGRLLDDNENRATPVGLAWLDDPDLNPMDLVAGRAPAGADEVVIDRASARDGDLTPGATVSVVTMAGVAPYTVSGIVTYGGADDAAGADVVAFTPETAAAVLGTPGRYDGIVVDAAPGTSQDEVVRDIATALAGSTDVEVITGAAMVAEAKDDARAAMAYLSTFLVAFAAAALLVGSFVIANSFAITVAQRSREHALLRAIGASRRQVLGAVLLESAVTGLVASAMGVVLGIATALGLRALLDGFGLDLPSGPTVVATRTIVVSMVLGTTIAIVAAALPARRGSKVAPMAAMRDVNVDRSDRSARRTVVGAVITAGGAALLAAGLGGAGVGPLGLGAVLVFGGVAVLGPVIARPVARLIGAPLARRGVPGSLARANASRNPRRTAATAAALMVGVGLVAFMTILADSAKSSAEASVDRATRADWIVSTMWGQGGLDPDVTSRIDALPETAAVTGFRYAPASVDDADRTISAFDPAVIDELIDLDVQAGDIGGLAAGGIAVHVDEAEATGVTVGDQVTVVFPETGATPHTVVALYETLDPMGPYAVSIATYDANVPDGVDHYVIADSTPGVPAEQVRTAVDGVLAGYPTAELLTNEEFKASLTAPIDQMLTLVYALLLLAVIIALLGIANALALAVHERTREIGLLRAVGMTRGQLRAAIRWEAVIVALLGTGLGMVIGFGFGWALVRALAADGLRLSIPTVQLVAVVVVGAFAGVVGAVSPARRAARLDVLTALRTS